MSATMSVYEIIRKHVGSLSKDRGFSDELEKRFYGLQADSMDYRQWRMNGVS